MLSGLGGGHLDDLAGSTLEDHKAIFAQGRALHWVGGRRARIPRLEVQLRIRHVCWRGNEAANSVQFIYTAPSLYKAPKAGL